MSTTVGSVLWCCSLSVDLLTIVSEVGCYSLGSVDLPGMVQLGLASRLGFGSEIAGMKDRYNTYLYMTIYQERVIRRQV